MAVAAEAVLAAKASAIAPAASMDRSPLAAHLARARLGPTCCPRPGPLSLSLPLPSLCRFLPPFPGLLPLPPPPLPLPLPLPPEVVEAALELEPLRCVRADGGPPAVPSSLPCLFLPRPLAPPLLPPQLTSPLPQPMPQWLP